MAAEFSRPAVINGIAVLVDQRSQW
jgi:hypothetical protein